MKNDAVSKTNCFQIELPACLVEARRLSEHIEKCCFELGFDKNETYLIELALFEAINNSIKHACKHNRSRTLKFGIEVKENQVIFTLRDNGISCHDLRPPKPLPLDSLSIEKLPENSFGLNIIHTVMNSVEFTPTRLCNTLVMAKDLPGPDKL